MTNEELADAVAKIAELDAKRTQHPSMMRYEHGGGRLALVEQGNRKLVADFYDEENREFYGEAPTMAQVIRQLWEDHEANRAVMEQVRYTLQIYANRDLFVGSFYPSGHSEAEKALAALDAALGNKGGE